MVCCKCLCTLILHALHGGKNETIYQACGKADPDEKRREGLSQMVLGSAKAICKNAVLEGGEKMNTDEIRGKLCSVLDGISRLRASANFVIYGAGLVMTEDDSPDSMSNDLRYGLTNLWDLIEGRFGKVEEDLNSLMEMTR